MAAAIERGAAMARWKRTVLAACPLPWDDRDRLVEEPLAAAVGRFAAAGLRDLLLLDADGEGGVLAVTEYRQATRVFLEAVKQADGVPVVGVTSPSVAETLRRIDYAAQLGCRTFILSLPQAGALIGPAELEGYFTAILRAFPENDFLHRNRPGSGPTVSPGEYAMLADRHPNLVATLQPGGDPATVAALHEYAPELRHVFGELGFYAGTALGDGCGLLATVAATNPARALAYLDAAERGDLETLTAMYVELAGMTIALQAAAGSTSEAALAKTVAKVIDPDFPTRMLTPYRGADPSGWKWYATALHNRWPQWLPAHLEENP
jgi:dihydrodipicolinate synthase/N-acetylneuraminate lyase